MQRNNDRIAALRATQNSISQQINTLEHSNTPQTFYSLKNSINQLKVEQKAGAARVGGAAAATTT